MHIPPVAEPDCRLITIIQHVDITPTHTQLILDNKQ